MTIEEHPLKPFLPLGARVLFLGSFPPPRKRWSMDFFYPNWLNDFWRIMGLIFLGGKQALEAEGEKRFDQEKVIRFATEHGLAFFDTARKVCRTKDNASDQFLEIQEPTDVGSLLSHIPSCTQVVTTGGHSCRGNLHHLPHRPKEDTLVAHVLHLTCLPHEDRAEGRTLPHDIPE